MGFRKQNSKKNRSIKKFIIAMIAGYVAIIIGLTFFISYISINKTDIILKTKVSSMTSALNVQMKMNLDSYLSKMETTGTLIFASEEAYTYDASDANNDEYEALSIEKNISDELFDLCIMENFVDFGIIYSNNHIVGKVSNGTKDLFGDRLYTDLSSFINRQRTNDGWTAGYNNNYTRIYYVKRIHDNAVLLISFYTTELEDVFEHPGGIDDITIRLVEHNNIVIYSSAENETGKSLPESVGKRISDNSSTIMDNEYLITYTTCGDDWKVICSVPTSVILKEKNEFRFYILIVCTVVTVIAIVFTVIFSLKMSDPVANMMNVLDKKAHIDLLTGVLNKRSFEEYAENMIRNSDKTDNYALILLDIDNFKGVNDTLGHEYGDKVLANIGVILRTVFREGDLLGRIGGDEFCVFLKITSTDTAAEINFAKKKCQQICSAFHNNYTGDDNSYKISASVGVSFCPVHGNSFSDLYKCADSALYQSKHKGKDTYTIYTEELK
ncbi:MAG: sensor domain-containing diguanylate cyclase [Oscillospiraceae bacterium]|nr:sensor domain-containing diguanylate cyclase [Oscillospiraceae bacterium]